MPALVAENGVGAAGGIGITRYSASATVFHTTDAAGTVVVEAEDGVEIRVGILAGRVRAAFGNGASVPSRSNTDPWTGVAHIGW